MWGIAAVIAGCSAAPRAADRALSTPTAAPPRVCVALPDGPPTAATTHDLAHLLPKAWAPSREAAITYAGDVMPKGDIADPVIAPTRRTAVIGFRSTPASAASPSRGASEWADLVGAADALRGFHARADVVAVARKVCHDDACDACLDAEFADAASGIDRETARVRTLATALDATTRNAPGSSDRLAWGASLEARAALAEDPEEVKRLLAEALFVYRSAATGAIADTSSAWSLYAAMRVAAALGDDARLRGGQERGAALVRVLGEELLTRHPPGWMRVEIVYRVALATHEAGEHLPAAVLREAVTGPVDVPSPDVDEFERARVALRVEWALEANAEGRALEAVEAIVPVWEARALVDVTASAEPILVDALTALGRYDGETLGRVDVDTFGRVGLEVGVRAGIAYDLAFADQALGAVRVEARDTLSFPQALRALGSLHSNDGELSRGFRAELAFVAHDGVTGSPESPWAVGVRARLPATTNEELTSAAESHAATNRMSLFNPHDLSATARLQHLLGVCHATFAVGEPLDVEVDAEGRLTVGGTHDWTFTSPRDVGRGSLRACLVEHGPLHFRSLGRPVAARVLPKVQKKRGGNPRFL